MAKYHIKTKEIFEVTYEVTADSKEKALDICSKGEGSLMDEELIDFHDDREDWEVTEIKDSNEDKSTIDPNQMNLMENLP